MTRREEKQSLRRTVRRMERELSPRYRAESSRRIAELVLSLGLWREADTVCCFVGTEREIDTRPILTAALSAGKRLCVPLCLKPDAKPRTAAEPGKDKETGTGAEPNTASETGTKAGPEPDAETGTKAGQEPDAETDREPGVMEMRRIHSLDELSPGTHGILEPPPEAPLVPADEIGLLLLPCLTCSHQGARLGQGGGYYDRFLSGYQGAAVVLCREKLVREEIPVEPWDAPVPLALTERGLWEDGVPAPLM